MQLRFFPSACCSIALVSIKISTFSKTVYTIFIKFRTAILRPKELRCAERVSKTYDGDLGTIAEVSPKMTKNRPIFHFFRFPLSIENFYGHSTP